jgi:branched-chain amino acid transport system ATP-binding protein
MSALSTPAAIDQTDASSGELVRVDDLAVAYGAVQALYSVSFAIRRGGLVLVLGPNGAGKTSLVKALAGAVIPRRGRVVLDGEDVTRVRAYKRVKRGVALVPEGRGTLPGLSVLDNLDLGWHAARHDRRKPKAESLEAISALFPVLQQRLHQDCGTLSGGEMQMLAISRALLSAPRVLLLDEPSLGLAPQPIARVYESLGELNEEGLAMVIVEQKVVPLARMPDLTIVLHHGRVVYQKENTRPDEAELAELYLGKVER